MTDLTDAGAGRPAFDRSRLIFWGVSLLTVVLVFGPILPIFIQAFLDKPLYDADAGFTLGNFGRLFSEPGVGRIFLNTLYFGALTMAVAQVFGAVMAVLVGRTNLPGRRWMGEVFIWPLFVSNLVIAFGWFTMYGPSGFITLASRTYLGGAPWNLYSVTGMGIVAGLSQAPLTYLMCLAAVTKADPQLEDAARSAGAGPFRALWSVTIPMIRPAMIYSAVLNFVIGIEMLAIPLLFGGPSGIQTVTTFLYDKGINAAVRPEYGIVGAAAILLLIVVALLVWLQGRLMQGAGRFVTVRGKASRPSTLDLGPWKWAAFAFVFGFVLLTILSIFGGIFLRSVVTFLTPLIPIWKVLTTGNFELVLSSETYVRSIVNSVVVSVVGAAIGTFFIVVIALIARRSEFRFRRPLEYVALFPRALPGIIAGLGFFYAVIWMPGLDAIRGTIFVLILAFVVRYIPVGFGAIAPALAQIGEELDRGARISGADWWTTVTRIILPILKPALFSCYALLFIHFFKEYVTAAFLYQPGSEIIGTTMLQLVAQGDNGPVSALATIQVIITALFVFLARRLLGAKIYG
ncbi:ABC transporter permease subunit [Frigidibacter albus]|uniref:ABC transporter permease subunit n=1 Tax=Frigidibacter albus TaxID=1465486 RepID=A0A6L8VFP9_9RHOB|nr:iron ABC transporter permease [Frigidibacter albus]MZQ89177.1 ABC transporter permease subunit [Frigidibacter albus]NBE30766.1 ABC transporter permease subunit [Frigidibacter albus]GGH50932.1 membrane protein [Frigidibacter albus]